MTAAVRCHLFPVLFVLTAIPLFAACGGKGDALPAQPPSDQSGESVDGQPAVLLALPAPSDIPRGASAPPTDGDRYRPSLAYDATLPHQRTGGMFELEFDPDWHPGDVATPDRLAYACYHFTNLTEYTGVARIKLDWSVPPPSYQHLWLAVADFDRDTWRWYPVPATNTVDMAHFDAFVSGNGEMLALVLLSGTDEATLRWIIIGDRLTLNAQLITDLNPDPAQNKAPLTVNFNGQGSHVIGGQVVAWDFDFEDDGNWDVEGDTDGLAERYYATPGAVTFRMRVHDDAGQQAETTVDFWVVDPANTPPTAHFTMNYYTGPAPLKVQLDASTSVDNTGIRSYEWDLDNDGLFETDMGTSPLVSYIFGNYGPTTVTLMVTDDDYATHTSSKVVTLTSGFMHSVVATGYNIARPMSAGSCGLGVNRRACVAWQDFGALNLKFSVATDAAGSTYAAPVDAAPVVEDTGFSPSLCMDALGFPMITYGKMSGDHNYDLEFVHATSSEGSAWNGPYGVSYDDHAGGENALAMVEGVPCIASITKAGTQSQTNIYFYQAADSAGTVWNSAVKLFNEPAGGMLYGVSLVVSPGGSQDIPIIGYINDTYVAPAERRPTVVHATDPNGSDWDPPVVFENLKALGTSLQVVGWHPAMVAGSSTSSGSLYYGRAGDLVGDTWPAGLTELASDGHGGYPDIALVGGNPAICYFSFDEQNLWYIDAADSYGTSWNEPYIVASVGNVGEFCSMAVLGGSSPVIFYNDDYSSRLMVAYWVP